MTHDEIQADLSSYALGALDLAERRAIEAHLAGGCVLCERELGTWQEVVGTMALAGQEAQPPDLKPKLMQQLQPGRRARVIMLPRSPVIPLAAAAAALLAFGVVREAGLRRDVESQQQQVASLRSELSGAQSQMQRLTQQLAAKEGDLAALRASLAAAQEQLAIIQTPGLQMVRLKETPDAKPAEAHVLMSKDSRRAILYAFDLPSVPADKAYELWWITEKEGPVNAGVFVPDQRGLGRIETAVPIDAGIIQAAAVTIEPRAGVAKPSGPMVLIGKL